MNFGLFGGTFDPVHRGHVAVARAASRRFRLQRVYFIPADLPPHKLRAPLTDFHHRYAMLALALQHQENFVPSLLEAGNDRKHRPNYTIETVRRFKASLKAGDRVFLIIGVDAFLEIQTWHRAAELLRECEFIVASRPGFSLSDIAAALPSELRPRKDVSRSLRPQPAGSRDLVLKGVAVHVLDAVHVSLSSTRIRKTAAEGRAITRFVDPAVAEYIRKMRLYETRRGRATLDSSHRGCLQKG